MFLLVDIKKWRGWWWTPLLVLGTNAIFAYVLSSVITTFTDTIVIDGVKLHRWAYEHLFATWLPPVNASLLYAVAIVLLNVLLVYPLYRRKVFLRI